MIEGAMVLSGNTSMSTSGLSRIVARLICLGFRVGGNVAPKLATRAALWLFTTPQRSKPRPNELVWLNQADSFSIEHNGRKLAVMAWGNGPVVLCVHGWSSRGLRFVHFIKPLMEAGYKVVAFDGPAHGSSSGSHVDAMEYAESILAVGEKIGPIHAILAHSFGATATMLALEKGLTVDRAVFFSALNGIRGPLDYLGAKLQLPETVLGNVKRMFERKFLRTIESLEAVCIVPHLKHFPLLVCHDKDDSLLPHHNALDLVRVWTGSELITSLGAGHETILDDPHLIQAATAFILRATSFQPQSSASQRGV